MADDHICKIRFLQESLPSYRSSLLSRVPTELCRIWCEAALKELGYANYLSKPSISTVQTLVILNIVHKNLGESCREYTLHGLAVNIARLIGIDRLGGRSDRPSNCLLKDTGLIRKNENVYRRLWWTLVICDWMTVWSRPISMHPDSFTTVLETEDGEEVPPIIAGEDKHIPSPFEYHKAMAQLAATMQNHARSINEWTTVAVRASFEELDSVAATFPPHLSYPGTDESVLEVEQGLEWIHVQRSLIFNCLDCWHINLCVALIPQLLGNPATGEDGVQQSGISCAKAILSRRYHDPCPHFHKFWATTCSTVTAAIFLALDLICFRHHRSSAEVAEEKALILFGIYLVERTCTDTRHDALLVLRRLVELSNVLRPRQFIDQKVFVRLMKLVASPKLWASFSDTEVTLRFLFADLSSTGEASKSALDHDEQIQSTDAGDVTCGNILPNTLSRFATVTGEAGDLLPLEDDLFSSELIDMSLPWLDPGSLMAFPNEVSF
ncbi:Phosphomannose isomerase type I family protein [Aspergillus niger]|uniref:Phosphomannose isomerase type I family protein n=1 Tax=Aspergillus niger TaxID=5061 RepID=A0A505I248_ASPNG|nr:Phosphomannose isomerase type I family protein [Aspergillus niger]